MQLFIPPPVNSPCTGEGISATPTGGDVSNINNPAYAIKLSTMTSTLSMNYRSCLSNIQCEQGF